MFQRAYLALRSILWKPSAVPEVAEKSDDYLTKEFARHRSKTSAQPRA